MTLLPVRLRPGEDVRGALESLVEGLSERSGFVVSGIGSLSGAALRMADETLPTPIAGPLEIVSLAGTLTADGVHLHMAVADARGDVRGGHVCRGCVVRTTAELLIAEVPGYRLGRRPDALTGFNELVVERIDSPPLPGAA